MMDNLYYLLALNRMPRVGPRTVRALLNQWPKLESLFALSRDELFACGLSERLVHALSHIDTSAIESDYAWLNQHKNRFILTIEHPHYPASLKEISDPPPVLYAEGQLECLMLPSVAIVGTRRPTVTGVEIAKQFAAGLSSHGLVIVSGLAQGIDAAAHEGCLKESGKTIAVFGTGIDRVYPRQHHALVERIKISGLILSEFPLTSPPIAGHFPRRNRIISGVSSAVLVVESAVPSGTLLTARLALEQNREVMAIPGSIRNPKASGCHHLLQQGARLVTRLQDVLDVFSLEETKKQVKKAPTREATLQHLLCCIGDDVATVDQLVVRSGQSVEDVVCGLMELEIEGVIQSLPSGYMRCAC